MEREERLAENEILFRDVNERINDLQADRWNAEMIDFMCECADQSCTMVIRLEPAEYEQLAAARPTSPSSPDTRSSTSRTSARPTRTTSSSRSTSEPSNA